MFIKEFGLQLKYASSTSLVGHSGMDSSNHFVFQRLNSVDSKSKSKKFEFK